MHPAAGPVESEEWCAGLPQLAPEVGRMPPLTRSIASPVLSSAESVAICWGERVHKRSGERSRPGRSGRTGSQLVTTRGPLTSPGACLRRRAARPSFHCQGRRTRAYGHVHSHQALAARALAWMPEQPRPRPFQSAIYSGRGNRRGSDQLTGFRYRGSGDERESCAEATWRPDRPLSAERPPTSPCRLRIAPMRPSIRRCPGRPAGQYSSRCAPQPTGRRLPRRRPPVGPASP